MPDQPVPCRYKSCVSFKSQLSGFGYCSIHHQVATVEHMYNAALRGQISSNLREFALELERGAYPSFFGKTSA